MPVLAVDDGIQIAAFFVPEAPVERISGFLGVSGDTVRFVITAHVTQPTLHELQRVVPERVDFNRFTAAGSNYPIAYLRVHPSKLIPFLSLNQQSVCRVYMNIELGAA